MMDLKSESFLSSVHPDLVKVMRVALQSPPFVVVYGLRSPAAEAAAVATHHSQTMRSRHLADDHYHGLALAVDIAALVGGEPNWAPGHEATVFGAIAANIKAAASDLSIPLQWGGEAIGAWVPGVVSHFRDWGHFQLPWQQYP